jgi:arylamine N-acetyltransferase
VVLVERYLRLLGVAEPPAGLAGLREIVHRHLCRAPFENVSKLLLVGREGGGRPLALAEFLDGIEHYDLGGTCYSCNPFLAWLLRELGYAADLLGADMSKPDVHTSIRVRLDGDERTERGGVLPESLKPDVGRVRCARFEGMYHVDVGYAAPFFRPISLSELPWETVLGPWRYVFDRGGSEGAYAMSVFAGAEPVHGYVVHPPARSREYFNPIVMDSFRPGQTFLTCLRITRFFDDGAVELKNAVLSRYRGAESSQRTLRNMAELRAALENDLAMPRCPVEEAVGVLERLTGKPFFGGAAYPGY